MQVSRTRLQKYRGVAADKFTPDTRICPVDTPICPAPYGWRSRPSLTKSKLALTYNLVQNVGEHGRARGRGQGAERTLGAMEDRPPNECLKKQIKWKNVYYFG